MSALEDIQEAVCAANEELKFWLAILPFKGVAVIHPKNQEEVDSDNILKYVTDPSHMGVKVRFPVAKYPPGDFMSEGWKKLKKDLETILFDNGTSVVSNGAERSNASLDVLAFNAIRIGVNSVNKKSCRTAAAALVAQNIVQHLCTMTAAAIVEGKLA
jgi:hypothetical protein